MKDSLSKDAYKRVFEETKERGSSTYSGKQREKEGLGLHELVDPKAFGVIRRSLSWYDPVPGDLFKLLRGVAMLEETRLDTTGSMGNNVDVAMRVLLKTYELYKKVQNPVLGRYDVQMITAIFGDVCDKYVLCRSQAEKDERIAEQMTHMVPEGQGGDTTEDPHYGIFGGAYLTSADINRYGLKYYDFTITDAPTRDTFSPHTLKRVYGEEVFDKLKENGFEMNESNLPNLKQVVKDLQKKAHAFVLLVGDGEREHWEEYYPKEMIIVLPKIGHNEPTEFLSEIKASIIGLTEGTLTLQTIEEFLVNDAHRSKEEAKIIKRAVAGIPIGAQTMFENFDKIPLAGTLFKAKRDLFPMEGFAEESQSGEEKPEADKKDEWL